MKNETRQMTIKIIEIVGQDEETGLSLRRYEWEVFDGPDGIEHDTGNASSIGEAFEQIIKNRTKVLMSYT